MDERSIGWVLHRHTLGDGSWHFDLMIGPWPGLADGDESAEARSLRSWRVMVDPRECERFVAEEGPDHRRRYLEVAERTLDGGRGTVRRVGGGTGSAGRAEVIQAGDDRVVVRLSDNEGDVRLAGERAGAGSSTWRFARG